MGLAAAKLVSRRKIAACCSADPPPQEHLAQKLSQPPCRVRVGEKASGFLVRGALVREGRLRVGGQVRIDEATKADVVAGFAMIE